MSVWVGFRASISLISCAWCYSLLTLALYCDTRRLASELSLLMQARESNISMRELCCSPFSRGQPVQVSTTEITEDEFKRLWATNVVGPFTMSARLTPLINEGARLLRCASLEPEV